MVRVALIVVLSCGLAGVAMAQPAPNRTRMEADVRALTDGVGPRSRNTEAARRAADEIERRARDLGLTVRRYPVGRVRSPAIRVAGRLIMAARDHQVDDDNLVVEIDGASPGPAVLIMAHYDTVARTPGAVDNAAGVAVLLELGRLLRAAPPARPVILAWTASEEHGLAGARALARDVADRVGLAIAIDLLGAADEIDLNGLSDRMGAAWLSWLARIARSAGVDVRAPIPQRVISRLLPAIERSDHGAFAERAVPALHLYSRGPERIYLDYHAPGDVPERIAWPAVVGGTRFLLALAHEPGPLPDSGGDPGLWLDVPGGPRVISWGVLIGIEALLLWLALAGIVLGGGGRAVVVHEFGRGLFVTALQLIVAWGLTAFALYLARRVSGHAGPWAHSPGRFYAASLAIATGGLFATAWLARRRLLAAGRARYLVVAALLPALLGIGFVIAGTLELALPCLAMAACIGGLGFSDRLAPQLALLALALWPLWGAIDPALLREATYHGFLPAGAPIWPALALLTLPHVLATVYVVRAPPRAAILGLPRWRLVMPIAAIVLIGAGTIAMLAPSPRCSGAAFRTHGLQCERY